MVSQSNDRETILVLKIKYLRSQINKQPFYPCLSRYNYLKMLDISIRVAESGVSQDTKIDHKSKVKQLQQVIKKNYKIQIADQLLTTKQGIILHSQQDLESFSAEKQKTYIAQDSNVNNLFRVLCVCVFSRKTLKSQENIKIPRDQQLQEQLRTKCKQVEVLNLKSEFKPLEEIKNKQQLVRLQHLNPNILKDINKILRSDERILNQMQQCEQFKSFVSQQVFHIDMQAKCFSSLLKSLPKFGQIIQGKIYRMFKDFRQFRDKRQEAIRKLQQLRKIPVKDVVYGEKEEKQKNLFELLFADQKIKEYMINTDKTIEQFQRICQTYKRQVELLTGKQGKMAECKNAYYGKFKTKQNIASQAKVESLNPKLNQIKNKREVNNRRVFQYINRWLNNQNDQQAYEYLINTQGDCESIISWNHASYEFLNKQNQDLKVCYINLHRQKMKNQGYFKQVYVHYEKIQIDLQRIQSQILRVDRDFNLMKRQLQSGWNYKECKQAYDGAKVQIQKRMDFLHKIYSLYRQGVKLNDEQQQRRRKYISSKKKVRAIQCFPQLQLMEYSAAKLSINEGNDMKLPKLQFNSSIKVINTDDKVLKDLEELTAGINNYKKSKENQEPNRLENKLQNLEDILIKTTKICHQIYSNKLKQQAIKYQQTISKMEEIRIQQEIAMRKMKEENKDLKFREKSEMQSQRQLKKNKSDLDQYKRKNEQFRSEPVQLSRLRDQSIRKDDHIRVLSSQIFGLQQNLKVIQNQKMLLMNELQIERCKKSKEFVALTTKYEQSQKTLQTVNKKKQDLELNVEILKNQIQVQHTETQSSKDTFYIKQIESLQQQVKNLEINIEEQSRQIEQQRMVNINFQKQIKNKSDQILALQKALQELQSNNLKPESNQKSDSEDQKYSTDRLESLKQQNIRLQQDVDYLQNQLKLILDKETFQIQTQSENNIIDVQQVEVGRTLVFIPYSNGVYVPLVLMESLRTQYQFSNTFVSSYKANYFLSMQTFNPKIKDLVNECSLIMLAKVQEIVQGMAQNDNQYGVKEGERYFTVKVEKPEYIIGFEEDDMSLKNYANI